MKPEHWILVKDFRGWEWDNQRARDACLGEGNGLIPNSPGMAPGTFRVCLQFWICRQSGCNRPGLFTMDDPIAQIGLNLIEKREYSIPIVGASAQVDAERELAII